MKVTSIRRKDGDIWVDHDKAPVNNKAFWLGRIVEFELGYGAKVTKLEECFLAIQTNIMGCVDEIVLEGSAEEMLPFVKVAAFYQFAINGQRELDGFKKLGEQLNKFAGGSPLVMVMGTGIFAGQKFAKVAVIAALIGDSDDMELVTRLAKVSLKDLVPILQLVELDGVDVKEAVELI